MPVEFVPAVIAGVVAGVVMTAMLLMVKLANVGLQMDMHRTWGAMLRMYGTTGWLVGLIIHLVLSGAVGILYAVGFAILGVSDNLWLWGLIGGFVHWLIAGMFMGALDTMHPEIPDREPDPGAFALKFGVPDVPGFLMTHLAYGVVVGVAYAALTVGIAAAF
ncbi:MAG: hypothetical protein M3N29_07325 [Chloroflexota bacterium]|nr:hypothetical protein [Chloroflexota bacterium]